MIYFVCWCLEAVKKCPTEPKETNLSLHPYWRPEPLFIRRPWLDQTLHFLLLFSVVVQDLYVTAVFGQENKSLILRNDSFSPLCFNHRWDSQKSISLHSKTSKPFNTLKTKQARPLLQQNAVEHRHNENTHTSQETTDVCVCVYLCVCVWGSQRGVSR